MRAGTKEPSRIFNNRVISRLNKAWTVSNLDGGGE